MAIVRSKNKPWPLKPRDDELSASFRSFLGGARRDVWQKASARFAKYGHHLERPLWSKRT